MMSGTASNSLALSSFLRSYGTVLCHAQAHINKDEGGAPEFFSCGGKLIPITNDLGRVSAKELSKKIDEINFKGKQNNICGVSITHLAENGTAYSPREIKEISKVCKNNNLSLHMDGARFSNALAFQKSLSPADITWKVGVDCLSLGATKNGAMAAEVIILNIISNLWSRVGHNNFILRLVTSFETEKSEIDELLSRINTFCSKC